MVHLPFKINDFCFLELKKYVVTVTVMRFKVNLFDHFRPQLPGN